LNTYTDEMGSDGVVRVAAANLNYSLLELVQDEAGDLKLKRVWRSRPTAFGILPQLSHSGDDLGIISSVSADGLRPAKMAKERGIPRDQSNGAVGCPMPAGDDDGELRQGRR